MNIIDQYIFYILIFSPLVASIFITLIPTIDTGSKHVISKFFSIIGFLVFVKIYINFLNNNLSFETALSLAISNFNINLNLSLNKYNIFLYGTASIALMANMSSYVINITKTDIHQASIFLLTFFLYISFGQTDLRLALPILSIANFLVYFLISSTDKTRRGTTIFQMGVFLFSIDAMILILLQVFYSYNESLDYFNFLFLIPGMARLCLPMFAPFMKKLLINIDDVEGPFLIIFLQLAGIFILILMKTDIIELSNSLIIIVSCLTTICAFYAAMLALRENKILTIPYYFLVFYSSMGCLLLFLSKSDDIWFFSISLFLTNIACFFHVNRLALLIKKYNFEKIHHLKMRSMWFLALGLFIGLPGLGIGVSFWIVIYKFISLVFFETTSINFWLFISLLWILSLVVLSFAFITNVRDLTSKKSAIDLAYISSPLPIIKSSLFATTIVILLSWLIPLATFYTKTMSHQ